MKMRSVVFVGVVALLIPSVPGSQSIAQVVLQSSRILLQESPMSKEITGLFVTEQLKNAVYNAAVISVQILGRSIPQCEGRGVPGANNRFPGANNRCGQYLDNTPLILRDPGLKT